MATAHWSRNETRLLLAIESVLSRVPGMKVNNVTLVWTLYNKLITMPRLTDVLKPLHGMMRNRSIKGVLLKVVNICGQRDPLGEPKSWRFAPFPRVAPPQEEVEAYANAVCNFLHAPIPKEHSANSEFDDDSGDSESDSTETDDEMTIADVQEFASELVQLAHSDKTDEFHRKFAELVNARSSDPAVSNAIGRALQLVTFIRVAPPS